MMVKNLAETRILVTNDDGIEAEGIQALERIARSLSNDVWVIAPDSERSGAGHSLTMHKPLRYRKVGEQRYAVSGTPTDCVLMATMEIMKDKRPELVLSGINRGPNLAEDVTYSGTVAAAMEATLLEIPAIAFSMDVEYEQPSMQLATAEHFIPDIVRSLTGIAWPDHTLINVNLPGVPVSQIKGVRPCPHGRRKIGDKLERRTDPRGRHYFWIAGPGTEPYGETPTADYHQLAAGYITVTPLSLDLTHYTFLEELRGRMDQAA